MLRPGRKELPDNCVAILTDLAVPRPFTMPGFRVRLEECTGREVHLVEAAMTPGTPSGIWLRTTAADYLYYEEQTSSFHQAHIVLHLSAHLLLGGPVPAVFDSRLAPSERLAEMMLGEVAPSSLTEVDAEEFAYLALRPAGRFMTPRTMTRALRLLRPLHSALIDAVPLAGRSIAPGDQSDVGRQLYRVVLEIREAALALRPFRRPETKAAAAECAREVGLADHQSAAIGEAVALAGAIRLGRTGRVAPSAVEDRVHATGPDLASEAVWLAQVSRAFEKLSLDDDVEHGTT